MVTENVQEIQNALRQYLESVESLPNLLESQRIELATAIDAVVRYRSRVRVTQWATALFDGLTGAFSASAIVFFILGQPGLAIGLLGPAAASVVGSVGFRSRQILSER